MELEIHDCLTFYLFSKIVWDLSQAVSNDLMSSVQPLDSNFIKKENCRKLTIDIKNQQAC